MDDCLNQITPNITNKFYTMARFFLQPQNSGSLKVLEEWLEKGDGSRFNRGNIEMSEFKELEDRHRVELLRLYSKTPMTYVLFFSKI